MTEVSDLAPAEADRLSTSPPQTGRQPRTVRNSLAALVLLAAVMLGAVGKPVAADDSILTQQMLTGD